MIDCPKTQKTHRNAMLLMQDALVAEVKGDINIALSLFSAAFDLEREAALDTLQKSQLVRFYSAAQHLWL